MKNERVKNKNGNLVGYQSDIVRAFNEDGSIRFTLTAKQLDRYSEVVMPKGVNLANFKSNPVVLWAHNFAQHDGTPIGKINPKSITVTDDSIEADVVFDQNDDFAKKVEAKIRSGFLNTGSIGFKAIDISKEPVLPGQKGATFTKSELMEFSIVPIPALPAAMAHRDYRELMTDSKEAGMEIVDDLINRYFDVDTTPKGGMVSGAETMIELPLEVWESDKCQIEEYNTLKAGKVISKKNRSLLENLKGNLETAIESLGSLLKADSAPEQEEEVENIVDEKNALPDEVNLELNTKISELINLLKPGSE